MKFDRTRTSELVILMARITKQKKTVQNKKQSESEAGQVVRLSVIIDGKRTAVPVPDWTLSGQENAFDPRADELIRVIGRVARSGELDLEEGDRIDIEVEFTGLRYKSSVFAERLEESFLKNWPALVSTGVVINTLKHKSFTLSRLAFKKSYSPNKDVYLNTSDSLIVSDFKKDDVLDRGQIHEEVKLLDKNANEESLEEGRVIKDRNERPEFLDALLASRGKGSYDQIADQFESEQTVRKQAFIAEFLPALRKKLYDKPHSTYEQKLEISRWINSELKRFDLVFTTKEFVGVATLAAISGGRGGEGRFQLKGKEADKEGESQYYYTQNLHELLDEVIVVGAPPRREALSEVHRRRQKPNDGVPRS